MTWRLRVAASAVLVAMLAAASPRAQQQNEVPRFRSAVEVTTMDVSVLDQHGQPLIDLKPADFSVKIDNTVRKVVSAEWVALDHTQAIGEAPPPPPDGYSSNESVTGGRLILIVVDELNIRFGGTMGIRRAMESFIDKLEPSDRAAVVGLGQGAPSTPFTADHQVLKAAVARLHGQQRDLSTGFYNVSLSEALDIFNQIPGALDRVVARECAGITDPAEVQACVSGVEADGQSKAQSALMDIDYSLRSLRSLLIALRRIDAPKTMLFVAEGLLLQDQQATIAEFGALSAAAQTTIYTLKLDDSLFTLDASVRSAAPTPFQDRTARAEGLQFLAAAARGALFNVVGTGDGVFDQIESELSGYYVIGVEASPGDRDGKLHPIRVDVNRKNVTVRSRRGLIVPEADSKPTNPREAVFAALNTPLPISALPIRVATFSLKGPEADKLQVLIHADVGTDYATSQIVSLAYMISDANGRVIDSQAASARLPPIMSGVPSPLQFAGGAILPPGDYSLKLAVAEGDRVGTVEHPLHVALLPGGAVQLSDLMVGGPATGDPEPLQPTVGYSVVFGSVHGYMEAYGRDVAGLKAQFEIARDPDGEPLLKQDISARTAGDTRAIFTRQMPVRQLPPGKYVLRATVSSDAGPLKTMTREFEVAEAPVLMTSASTGTALPPTDVFLPVLDSQLSRPFDKSLAAQASTVQAFRSRVPESARAAFDTGVAQLASGDYAHAEETLKSAINPDIDSTAIMVYLAAVYAAAGHDRDAAGAWQTSLIDGSDLPDIYAWLGDTLLRSGDLAQARAVLGEAIQKWPSDPRFTKPAALTFATFGQGREAVRTLERYLEQQPADLEANYMAVEWIYNLHRAGAIARSRDEDRQLARRCADAYLKANGPQSPLVKQWMDYLER